MARVTAPGAAIPPADVLRRVAAADKALAVGRLHRKAMHRRMAVIRRFRDQAHMPRALEAYWVVLAAMVARLEGRPLTQKDLAASGTGAISAATISRAVNDVERHGWIVTAASGTDSRSQVIEPTPRALAFFVSPERVAGSWDDFFAILAAAVAPLQGTDPAAWPFAEAWLARLDLLPVEAKALATGRLQLTTFERAIRIILRGRAPGDFARAYEGFWVIVETIVAALEGSLLTQKDLTIRARGLTSAATISRVIGELQAHQWVTIEALPTDSRVRVLAPSALALQAFLAVPRVEQAWRACTSIFLQASEPHQQ